MKKKLKIESCTIGFIHPFRLWPYTYGQRWNDYKQIGFEFLIFKFEINISGLKNLNGHEDLPF